MTARRLLQLALLCVSIAGCATWQAPADLGDAGLRARAIVQSEAGVRVSGALLGREDCRRMLGADVTQNGIQPVWLEVSNDTPVDLWLLKAGTGPDYFSPLEAAWSAHARFGGSTNDRIDEHFERVALPSPVPAGETRSGIVFVAPEPRRVVLTLDLIGSRSMIPISMVLMVPGSEADDADRQLQAQAELPKTDYQDLDALRTALEQLPSCATTAGKDTCSEPLNVIFVGNFEDMSAAINRRGFRRDFKDPDLVLRVYGRPPDSVVRKRADAAAPASWIRVWLAPITYEGYPVFVGQVARPVGGRFNRPDATRLPMHGDVDEARDSLIQDNMYSGGLQAVGFLASTGAIPASQPRKTGDGATYFTDGHRAVLFYATRPLTVSDVQFLDWIPLATEADDRARAATQNDDDRPK